MNKTLIRAALAAAGLAVSGSALAAPYAGGAFAISGREYDDVDTAYGWQGFLGYRFDAFPIQLEAGYFDAGDADITSWPGVSLNFSGLTASVGAYFASPALVGWVKAGYYDGDAEIGDSFTTLTQDSSGAFIGAGVDWNLTETVALRFDLQNYFEIKDFTGQTDINGSSDVTVIAAGIVLNFPSGARTGTRTVSNNVRAAPTTPAYPAATSPAPALAPAARPAAPTGQQPYAAGQSVAIAKATPLLDQPRSDAGVGRFLALGEVVILRSYVVNARGTWWYVQSSDLTGWVAEPTLGAQQP
ncbi:MAG: outer membrane beta-barrel protein [Nevskiales bacterium]|nr:outer membrane beta-barrel protein [Nevskiales bacterium]